ncbi:hypothetical protein HDV05_001574 [Chytridiales sp. JEL 0842]|nr:hypothetical protein HDV05_001574 [Chytridiales sp. JEL 0842]
MVPVKARVVGGRSRRTANRFYFEDDSHSETASEEESTSDMDDVKNDPDYGAPSSQNKNNGGPLKTSLSVPSFRPYNQHLLIQRTNSANSTASSFASWAQTSPSSSSDDLVSSPTSPCVSPGPYHRKLKRTNSYKSAPPSRASSPYARPARSASTDSSTIYYNDDDDYDPSSPTSNQYDASHLPNSTTANGGGIPVSQIDFSQPIPLPPPITLPDGEKRFECFVQGCDRAFTRLFNLKSHLQTHNPKRERVFKCAECGVGFCRAQDLLRHGTVHDKSNLMSCPACPNKTFSRKDALRRHIRVHGCCPLDSI